MSNFITLTKEQFEEILPKNFLILEIPKCKEIVYDLDTKNPDVHVRIYSTVDVRTKETRGLGEDAIRVVFWDVRNDRPLGKGRKILRVEGKTTIQERIKQRIAEFLATAHNQDVVDFEYVKAVLNSDVVNWMDFAQSLADSLETYKSLTEKQLAYVLGDRNPKGKATFETQAKEKDPNFLNRYLATLEEGKNGNEERETKLPDEDTKKKNEFETQTAEGHKTVEDVLGVESVMGGMEVELKWSDTKSYSNYKYPFKQFNPVQTAILPHVEEDKNMVIGSSTGSGKTIACELIIDYIFNN